MDTGEAITLGVMAGVFFIASIGCLYVSLLSHVDAQAASSEFYRAAHDESRSMFLLIGGVLMFAAVGCTIGLVLGLWLG